VFSQVANQGVDKICVVHGEQYEETFSQSQIYCSKTTPSSFRAADIEGHHPGTPAPYTFDRRTFVRRRHVCQIEEQLGRGSFPPRRLLARSEPDHAGLLAG
jgi:hypothetical protein